MNQRETVIGDRASGIGDRAVVTAFPVSRRYAPGERSLRSWAVTDEMVLKFCHVEPFGFAQDRLCRDAGEEFKRR